MTPIDFREALAALKVSQLKFARLVGLDGRTARRYASGEHAIPEPTAKLLRLALSGKISVDDISSA